MSQMDNSSHTLLGETIDWMLHLHVQQPWFCIFLFLGAGCIWTLYTALLPVHQALFSGQSWFSYFCRKGKHWNAKLVVLFHLCSFPRLLWANSRKFTCTYKWVNSSPVFWLGLHTVQELSYKVFYTAKICVII